MIPLLLDLAGRHVLVCGGGEVAARKTAFFLPETGVTVVSRSFHSFLRESDARLVEADLDELGDEELQVLCAGMFLVIAATPDPNLNDRIVRAARRTGAHANSATGGGDVHLPAVSRGERFLVAVATGGDSPGMARFLREAVERAFPCLDAMVGLQARLRRSLRDRPGDQEARAAILRRVLMDNDVWDALVEGDDRAWNLVEERYLDS